jgi:hypothetical protein
MCWNRRDCGLKGRQCGSGSGVDKNLYAEAAAHRASLSSRAEAQLNDCGFGRVRGDHPGAPGRGDAVPAQVGVEMSESA